MKEHQSVFHGNRLGRFGMVSSAHPLATLAGLEALRQGGNAMDACITMAAVTSVVLPHMCGLGGDAFFIYYDAKNRRIAAANSSGPAGNNLTLDFAARYLSMDRTSRGQSLNSGATGSAGGNPEILPQDGIFSVAVPGAPLLYEKALEKFGTFSLAEAFEPAIQLAQTGIPVTDGLARAVCAEQEKLLKYRNSLGEWDTGHNQKHNLKDYDVFLPGGQPLKTGEILIQENLARTLEEFSQGGASYFYKGAFAEAFMEFSRKLGGSFDGTEFEEFFKKGLKFYTPISVNYRGYTIYETAPVSQGFILLEELKILEHFDLSSMDPLSAEYTHLLVEAKKLSFQDRNLYAGDPEVTGFNVDKYISPQHALFLWKKINPSRVIPGYSWGSEQEGDTTSFVAVDRWGNACSFIHSNAFSFGSGLIVPGTGVILNNRAGRSFLLKEGHPNCLAPGKRPMHTLNCYMVFRNDGGTSTAHNASESRDTRRNHPGDESFEQSTPSNHVPFIVGGTPGGDGQPQWNMQLLCLMLDHGFGPQDACDFPRWLSFPGTDVINLGKSLELRMESRFPSETMRKLRDIGHTVRKVGAWAGGGGAQIIMIEPESGLLLGGSDKRVEGLALGY